MRGFVVSVLTAIAVLHSALWASSYVMVTDADLARQADLIVAGRIVAGQSSLSTRGRPQTVYAVEVDQVVKGNLQRSPLNLRVPGGRAAGIELQLFGVPRFVGGERVLLFLTRRGESDHGLLHLMLGAFRIIESQGRSYAVRDLQGAQEVRLRDGADRSRFHRPRGLDGFMDWIAAAVAGEAGPADYFLEATPALQQQIEKRFTLLKLETTPIRWFNFDAGSPAPWNIHSAGQPGLPAEGGNPGGTGLFQQALSVWNNDADTDIDYQLTGVTDKSSFRAVDPSVVVFNDLFDEIPQNYGCAVGGTLAIGGPLVSIVQTGVHKGRDFHPIARAEINMNAGIDCLLAASPMGPKLIEEVFGHELGHTLGLGHSCGDPNSGPCGVDPVADEALMRAFAHLDGRGASINADDRAGISFLYGSSLEAPGQKTFYFAQVGDGRAGSVQFRTTLIFHNTQDISPVVVEFFRGAGVPMNLPFLEINGQDQLTFDLARGETRSFATLGTGVLQVGYARIVADQGVNATAVFERIDNGVTVTQAGVPPTGLAQSFSVVSDFRGAKATGFAIVHPPIPDGGPADANVTLRLYDSDFTEIAVEQIVLQPGQHLSQFVAEAFSGVPIEGRLGSLTVESDQPLAAVTLLQDDDTFRRPFPLSVPTLSAFPVIPGRADGPALAAGNLRRLAGDRVQAVIKLSPGAEALAAVFLLYDGDRLEARFVREIASGGTSVETFRLPHPDGDWKMTVRLIEIDGRIGDETALSEQ